MSRIRPGTRIGPYAVGELIGTGGMGEVYRARDTALDREVAIKFLTARLDDPARQARFEREARTLACLSHPNIAAIYGVATTAEAHGLVLELVEGETLESRLARGRLPVTETVRIGAQIAAALAAAHAKGIVHRDLKPSNITVARDGLVKVLDFGLAKAVVAVTPGDPGNTGDNDASVTVAAAPGVTQAGAVVGTPRYMSPEQARGEAVDCRTDLWALGCILYEAVTGRPAFGGKSSADALAAVITSTPDFGALAELPPAVADVIQRCLEKDPDKRPATAGAAYASLEQALRPGQVPAIEAPLPRSRPATPLIAGIAAAALVALGWMLWSDGVVPTAPPPRTIRSVAVRPLENLSRDSSQEYFSEGMTDALTTQLAKTAGLRVVSRTSASRLAGRPVPEIARVLNVDAVVEGSVLFANERVRVNARLIDALSDTSLWAESYERAVGDVLLLQQDVARAIAQRVQSAASPNAAPESARPASAVNPEAYREYLQGRYLWNRRTAESLEQAIAHFERAIELQPDYAPAHSGIAESLVILPAPMIGRLAPAESLPRARAAALRALQLDPTLASAHAALARERLQAWDWSAADSESKRAVELEPNTADWRFWRGAILAALGRHDEAVAEARIGTERDPVSPIVGSGLAWMYHMAGRFDEALRTARQVLDYEPTFAIAHGRVGEALLALDRPSAALDAFRRGFDASGGSPDMLAMIGHAQARAGRRGEALATADTLLELRKTRYVSEYDLVVVYAGLGDSGRALEWLARAVAERAAAVPFINVDPVVDGLRQEPRFQEIVRRIGLAPR